MKPICKMLAAGLCAGALLIVVQASGAAKHTASPKKHPHHPKTANNSELTKNAYIYAGIQKLKGVSSSASTDNWQTGTKHPKHRHHKKKAVTTPTGKRVWQPVPKLQIDHPNMSSDLVNGEKAGSKPAHPHHKKK